MKTHALFFDESRCLYNKNKRGMTVGDLLVMVVGETYKEVVRVKWDKWCVGGVEGGRGLGLFKAFRS